MKRIVVGISGASGFPLAVHLLKELKANPEVEAHLVFTYGAELTAMEESHMSPEDISVLADVCYNNGDIGAAIASGSFETAGMIIVPCSMKTVAGIAHGYSDNLLLRAADVMIKEKRTLVLAARECPFSAIHLDNMAYLARLPRVFVMPPVLTYYSGAGLVEEMEHHLIAKMLEKFGIEVKGYNRWGDQTDKTEM